MKSESGLLARVAAMEHALGAGKPASAFAVATGLLSEMRHVLAPGGWDRQSMDESALGEFCERFSAAWVRTVTDAAWDPLGDPQLPRLLASLQYLYAIVGCTAAGNLDAAIIAQAGELSRKATPAAFLKVMLLWTPRAGAMPPPFRHFENIRAVVVAQALATIGAMICCDERSDAARAAAIDLLNSGRVLPADLLPFVDQPIYASAWFRCSYSGATGKHGIKRLLNEGLVGALAAMPVVSPDITTLRAAILARAGNRPVMVVPTELAFCEGQAMHRCYAPIIRDLRRRFCVVGFAEQRNSDESTAALFDVFSTYEDISGDTSARVAAIAGAIRALMPAALFYPSIGMLPLVIWLANLRLAPFQAMSVGHPATSMSGAIDCLITEDAFVGDHGLINERLLLAREGAMVFDAPSVQGVAAARQGPASDDHIHVAIPAVGHKISWALVNALRRVEAGARRPVTFHFFAGVPGLYHREISRSINPVLKGAVIHGWMNYQDYIARIDRCHVHAASFPFGGTNSLIDSLRQGVPVVALRGAEVHECIDAEFVRRVGLEKQLVATTPETWADILLRFVNDDEFRQRMRHRVRDEVDVENLMMRTGRPQEFTELLWEGMRGGVAAP